ncbi:hypothetical protein KR009_010487 [Drosophila setifemur]|nr:hypothetical protein KR009_010487 [Drosophila setifemur]
MELKLALLGIFALMVVHVNSRRLYNELYEGSGGGSYDEGLFGGTQAGSYPGSWNNPGTWQKPVVWQYPGIAGQPPGTGSVGYPGGRYPAAANPGQNNRSKYPIIDLRAP